MSKESWSGVYFNRVANEVMSVTDTARQPGPQWLHVSDETRLGLLAIRKLLAERGLAPDPTAVYWYLPQPLETAQPPLGCDSAATRPTNARLLARLRATLRDALVTTGGRALRVAKILPSRFSPWPRGWWLRIR